MKKILFLSPAYPYGHLSPSYNCTVRIMDALVQTGNYEVYDISYRPRSEDSSPNYKLVDGVKLIYLPYSEKLKKHSRFQQRVRAFLRIPIYPLDGILAIWQYYKFCKSVLKKEKFDLVISQFNPFEAVISGALLKRGGYINKHIVLSWDVIYGKNHNAIIPHWYALKRQRKVVKWIAPYTDKIVTIYSQKSYHEQYGDVSEAKDKRRYLGIPVIARTGITNVSSDIGLVKEGKINIIYAGSIYSESDLEYAVKLLNTSSRATQLNLILLCKDPSLPSLQEMIVGFKGSVQLAGWISVEELYSMYSKVNVLMSFSGKGAWGVPGKTYEFLCIGKPILHFYSHENDANLTLFAPYPLFKGINVNKSLDENRMVLDDFLSSSLGKNVKFEEVEKLFPFMAISAYMKLIEGVVES